MIQGIKLQRGGRQTEKNYAGYVVKYGSMTLADVKANGFVPLDLKFPGLSKSNLSLSYNTVTGSLIVVNPTYGNTTKRVYYVGASSNGGNTSSTFDELLLPLEAFYGGDIHKCAAVTDAALDLKGTRGLTATVIRWLVPSGQIPPDGKLWLYKDGDECADVTGGWNTLYSNPIVKNADSIKMTGTSYMTTEKCFDPTKYDELVIEGTFTGTISGAYNAILFGFGKKGSQAIGPTVNYNSNVGKFIYPLYNKNLFNSLDPTETTVQINVYSPLVFTITKIYFLVKK